MTTTLLNNRYQVTQVLAEGGFGKTFLAEDTHLPSRRRCVVKQLKPIEENQQVYQIVVDRFQREAAILEDLGDKSNTHQIPKLYAYFEEDGLFYLVQEWVDGQTLASKVQAEGRQTEAFTRQFLLETLPALEFIHSRRIIHRDLKPDNIILRRDNGIPVLIDFGAVKETVRTLVNTQGHTVKSLVIGTPGFMCLEQQRGRPIFSSDLYSLGMTAIYLLTAKIPHELNDLSTGQILWRTHASPVSDRFAELLDRTICDRKEDRYPTASVLLAAVQALNTSSSASPIASTAPSLPDTIVTPSGAVGQSVGQSFGQPVGQPVRQPVGQPVTPISLSSPPAAVNQPPNYSPLVSTQATPVGVAVGNSMPSMPVTRPEVSGELKRRLSLILGGLTGVGATIVASFVYVDQSRLQTSRMTFSAIEALHSQGKYQDCLQQAQNSVETIDTRLKNEVQVLIEECSLARDEDTFQAAVEVAARPNADLAKAIQMAETVPKSSSIYTKVKGKINEWRSTDLQNYLRDRQTYELLKEEAEQVFTIVNQIQPKVQVSDEAIAITYTTQTAALLSENALRSLTPLFMQLLQGNQRESIPGKYTNFSRLVVHSEQGKQQATITRDEWEKYTKGNITEDALKQAIALSNR